MIHIFNYLFYDSANEDVELTHIYLSCDYIRNCIKHILKSKSNDISWTRHIMFDLPCQVVYALYFHKCNFIKYYYKMLYLHNTKIILAVEYISLFYCLNYKY